MAETVTGNEMQKMEELLAGRIGRRVELHCGSVSLKGEVLLVGDGIVHLDCDPSPAFVAIKYVSAFIEGDEGGRDPIGIGLRHNSPEPL